MKKFLLLAIIPVLPTLFPLSTKAQTAYQDYTEILNLIDQNSPVLKAERLETEAEMKGHHTGLVPDNPEVGFSYLLSNQGGPQRWDFTASQSFDFPSVYVYQARAARLSDSASHYRYLAARAQIMMEAQLSCMELIYTNALEKHSLEKRAEMARQLAEMTQAQFDKGQLSVIEYNKAQINLLDTEKKSSDLATRKAALYAKLKRLAGNENFVLEQDLMPEIELPPDFETFFAEVCAINPFLKQAQSESRAAAQQAKADAQQWLPSFTVGYMGEHVFDDGFNGVQIGLSLPFWQNKNRVKQAKLQQQAAENRELDAQYQLREQLETLYNTVAQLNPIVKKYRENLDLHNNLPYLDQALEKGEFSPMEYLLELQYHFDMIDDYLQAELELATAHTQLLWLSGLAR